MVCGHHLADSDLGLSSFSLPDTLQHEAICQTQLSRSEHPEPVERRSWRLLRQAQDAAARLGEKVSGSEPRARAKSLDVLTIPDLAELPSPTDC